MLYTARCICRVSVYCHLRESDCPVNMDLLHSTHAAFSILLSWYPRNSEIARQYVLEVKCLLMLISYPNVSKNCSLFVHYFFWNCWLKFSQQNIATKVLEFLKRLLQSETQFETARPVAVERTKPHRRKKRASSTARTAPVSTHGTVGRKYPSKGKHPGHEPPEHFHVNLAEIPFVTGKVTACWCLFS